MPSLLSRASTLATVAAVGVAFVLPASASAAAPPKVAHCDGVVQRVPVRDGTQNTALQAATAVTIRGNTCKYARNIVGGMMLQVRASPVGQPSGYADERDFWTKVGWTVRKAAGDPNGERGQRWWVTRNRNSLRFTLWK